MEGKFSKPQEPLRRYGDGLCGKYGCEFSYNPYFDNSACRFGCGRAIDEYEPTLGEIKAITHL